MHKYIHEARILLLNSVSVSDTHIGHRHLCTPKNNLKHTCAHKSLLSIYIIHNYNIYIYIYIYIYISMHLTF